MGVKIRNAVQGDIPRIEALYDERKVQHELRWLFTDPDDQESLNAYVLEDDNDGLVGVIGHVVADYQYQGKTYTGSIAMSWKLKPGLKGFGGVQLFKKVMDMGEFGFAIGGSDIAKDLYAVFKLKYAYTIKTYYKIFKPFSYFLSLNNSFPKKIANLFSLIPSYIHSAAGSSGKVRLEAYNPDKDNQVMDLKADVFQKVLTVNYIKWLLQCPLHETYAKKIYYQDSFMGIGVIYIHKIKSRKRARFVYVPYIENPLAFKAVYKEMERFVKREGCLSVSALGMHENTCNGLKTLGYVNFKRQDKPFFIKDTNDLVKNIPSSHWHMQYTEGDKAYRDI